MSPLLLLQTRKDCDGNNVCADYSGHYRGNREMYCHRPLCSEDDDCGWKEGRCMKDGECYLGCKSTRDCKPYVGINFIFSQGAWLYCPCFQYKLIFSSNRTKFVVKAIYVWKRNAKETLTVTKESAEMAIVSQNAPVHSPVRIRKVVKTTCVLIVNEMLIVTTERLV